MMEKATLPALAYTSPLEALAERFHCSPALLQRLNPSAAFGAGERIVVPNVAAAGAPIAADAPGMPEVTVSRADSSLTVARGGRIVFYAPVTSGSEHDPLPIGQWKVTAVLRDPKFHYNPDLFWDADPSHAKATIAPGPNNPVGLVWIDLSKEHYGIHGTPEPSRIGYTQSHGCVRLTNWDALHVAGLVRPGTRVIFR
jgi:lipoprotein-anchoring transpeptidase ErfK/SrfK